MPYILVTALAVLGVMGYSKSLEVHQKDAVVDLSGARLVDLRVELPGGRLNVFRRDDVLFDLSAEFQSARHEPHIDYQVEDGRGTLTVGPLLDTKIQISGADLHYDTDFAPITKRGFSGTGKPTRHELRSAFMHHRADLALESVL